MADASFQADLALYGPQVRPPRPLSARQARRYCRRLARRHYENFTVVSWLLPSGLRQHFYNLYAYCRWADDLADETASPEQGLALLGWWEQQLHECYQGRACHPVFLALSETIRRFEIPPDPLVDLLVAFRQDQQVTRYETLDQLLNYCRYSANPVGRLVLYLGRCHTPQRVRWSDSICTGLQLANFCQDVALDYQRGRIYLPMAHCRRFGYREEDFARGEAGDQFRRLLEAELSEAEGFLRRGLPLVESVPDALRLDVALFIRGGLAILESIRACQYDVWTRRPSLSRLEKLRLAVETWWQLRRGTFQRIHSPREQP